MKRDLTASSSSQKEWPVFPNGQYDMEIINAEVDENTLAKPDEDGNLPLQLMIEWEMLNDVPSNATIRQYMPFWYGDKKSGAPSQMKEILDKFAAQGLINLNLKAFDEKDLIGIKQRNTVIQYTKTMGKNAGQLGNKIVAMDPIPGVGRKPIMKSLPEVGAQSEIEERFIAGVVGEVGTEIRDGERLMIANIQTKNGGFFVYASPVSRVARAIKGSAGKEVVVRVIDNPGGDEFEALGIEDGALPF